jgi:hypothetical protein
MVWQGERSLNLEELNLGPLRSCRVNFFFSSRRSKDREISYPSSVAISEGGFLYCYVPEICVNVRLPRRLLDLRWLDAPRRFPGVPGCIPIWALMWPKGFSGHHYLDKPGFDPKLAR